jgi:gamma-glutamyltranspeptidase/glutathione hydrolase
MHLAKLRGVIGLLCLLIFGTASAQVVDEKARTNTDQPPPALAEGQNGMVVGTSGPMSVRLGLETLKDGGTAVDAVLATALAQVVECAGSYVSHAGVLSMLYYEASSGKVHHLNAGFNTPREENEPLSIPGGGKPSGRTALVPGFMAGVQAAHDRFGKLTRTEVFAPAIEIAERGFKVNAWLGRTMEARKPVLSRLPASRRIFTKEGDSFYAERDQFHQPELANTLRHVAKQGAAFMYTGEWADQFVAAVQREGGRITHDDMKRYRATWDEPLQTIYRGHQVYVPGFSSHGGVTMIEALHLLQEANLPKRGHYTTTPASLFWLMQISHCQVLDYLPTETLKNFDGLDLTAHSRVKKETAAAIWQRMQGGKWSFAANFREQSTNRPNHSDGIVAVDRWGNVAALTHSINTVIWGNTGLFVGGVSIPDAAGYQQAAIQETRPGERLADAMCPMIVLDGGKPSLGSSVIGGGVHQKTLQVLASLLDFGMDPQLAVEQPAFLLPAFPEGPPVAQVERGKFDAPVLEGVRALGQRISELSKQEADAFLGYWVGIQIAPTSKLRRGLGTRQSPLPSVAAGY